MNRSWWKESVVYQIYPKSFYDMNGDGYGDIKGIINKLPYVAGLGVNAIWLTPFFKSPMIDNGYDISDYMDIDLMFGNMADVEELIEKAKDLGIKVIIDLVLNHTSSKHPWFMMAKSSEDNPYRDYYIFRDTEDGLPPNNWRSIFGGSAWEKAYDSSFYLHTFDKEQPDLNWENPEVRKSIYEIINFWRDKGVQGFRIDAITFIKKSELFTSRPQDNEDGLRAIGKDTLNQPGIHDFLQEMKQATYSKGEYMTVAEAPGVPHDCLEDYVGEDGAFSMIFDFSYTDLDLAEDSSWYPNKQWTIKEYREKIFKSQMEHQKVGWVGLFTESHDQPRSIDKFFGIDNDHRDDYIKATVLATMYFFMRGTPFIYQGQELGMRNHKFNTIEEVDDISTIDHYKRAMLIGATKDKAMEVVNRRSRDHARTPMLWSSGKNAGFTEGIPWLPVNECFNEINAETQLNQKCSVYKYYKRMIELRKEEKEYLVYGQIETIFLSEPNLIAYKRGGENGKYIIVLTNLSEQSITVNHGLKDYKVLLGNYMTSETDMTFSKGQLRPFECLVIKVG